MDLQKEVDRLYKTDEGFRLIWTHFANLQKEYKRIEQENKHMKQELEDLKANVLITKETARKGGKKKSLDDMQIAKIQHERMSGKGVRELAREYGVSPATIVNYTKCDIT